MCIRCRQVDAPQPLGFCTACAVNAKLELVSGFGRLEAYLTSWAAFAEWLRARETEA